jgi:hypothetical protein
MQGGICGSHAKPLLEILVRASGIVGVDGGVLAQFELCEINSGGGANREVGGTRASCQHLRHRPAPFRAGRGRLRSVEPTKDGFNLALPETNGRSCSLDDNRFHQILTDRERYAYSINLREELENLPAVRLCPIEPGSFASRSFERNVPDCSRHQNGILLRCCTEPAAQTKTKWDSLIFQRHNCF